jgi:hypothetical protein
MKGKRSRGAVVRGESTRGRGFGSAFDDIVATFVTAVPKMVMPRLPARRANGDAPATNRSRRTGLHGHPSEQASNARKMGVRLRRLRAIQRAVEWQLQLETGEIASRSEIAKREGISLAAVTQAMRVLNVFEDGRGDLLPTYLFRTRRRTRPSAVEPFRKLRDELLRQFETDYVTSTLHAARGDVSLAARLAQIDRKQFWRLLRRSGATQR